MKAEMTRMFLIKLLKEIPNEAVRMNIKQICEVELDKIERLAKIGKITEWMYRRDYTLQAWGVDIDSIEYLLEYEEEAENDL